MGFAACFLVTKSLGQNWYNEMSAPRSRMFSGRDTSLYGIITGLKIACVLGACREPKVSCRPRWASEFARLKLECGSNIGSCRVCARTSSERALCGEKQRSIFVADARRCERTDGADLQCTERSTRSAPYRPTERDCAGGAAEIPLDGLRQPNWALRRTPQFSGCYPYG